MAVHDRCRPTASFLREAVLSLASSTCASRAFRVYSEHYSAYAGCASARPPGADTRRPPPPPPWRGSSLFWGPLRCPDRWRNSADSCGIAFSVASSQHVLIHSRARIHKTAATHWHPRRYTPALWADERNQRCPRPWSPTHRLAHDVDRVAAAAGVAACARDTSRRAGKPWTGAHRPSCSMRTPPAAAPDLHCLAAAMSSLLSRAEPQAAEWQAAITVGAQHVMTLPADESDLVAALSEAAEFRRDDGRRGAVVAVMAGRGGAGASLFATAIAQTAANALLVDVDPWGGGVDLAVGSEDEPGLRWPDLDVGARQTEHRSIAPGAAPAATGSACCRAPAPATTSSAGPLGSGDRRGPARRCDRGLRPAAAF